MTSHASDRGHPLTPTRVGIALVAHAGAYLVRQRPELPNSPMPGFWEFPGGKCEQGEPPAAAAVRECREESGLAVAVLKLRRRISHKYPHGLVDLHYFDCALASPEDAPPLRGGFLWLEPRQLALLAFPDANQAVLEELLQECRLRETRLPQSP